MVKIRNILFSVLGGLTAAITLNTSDARPVINTEFDKILENIGTIQDPTLEEGEYLAYADNSMGGLIENYFNTPDGTIPYFMTNIVGPQQQAFAEPERFESDYYVFSTTLNENNIKWIADSMDETFERYANFTKAHHLNEKLYIYLPKDRSEFARHRISPIIPEGLGGLTLTTGLADMMFPFEGSYADLMHVGDHEGWHQFQIEVIPNAVAMEGKELKTNSLPLLLIEGQAEYFSEGWDTKKQMVVKDLFLNNSASLFTIENLNSALYGSYPLYPMGTFVVKTMEEVSPGSSVRLLYEMDSKKPRNARFDLAFKSATGMTVEEFDGILIQHLQTEFESYRDLDTMGQQVVKEGRLLGVYDNTFLTGITTNQHTCLYINTTNENGKLIKRLVAMDNQLHMDSLHYLRFGADINENTIVFPGIDGFDDILFIQKYEINEKGNVKLGKRKQVKVNGMNVIRNPVFLNDSEVAFIGTDDQNLDIYKVNIETGAIEQLTDSIEAETSLDFSPQFNSLLFSREDMALHEGTNGRPTWTFQNHLYEMMLENQVTARVTDNNFNEKGGHYSPSGNQIIFVGDQGNDYNIYIVDERGHTIQVSEEPIAGMNAFFIDEKHIQFNTVKKLSLDVRKAQLRLLAQEQQILEDILSSGIIDERFELENNEYVTKSFVPIINEKNLQGIILEAVNNKGQRVIVKDTNGEIILLDKKEPLPENLPEIGYDEFKRAISPNGEYLLTMNAPFLRGHPEKNSLEFKVLDLTTGEEKILPKLKGMNQFDRITNLAFLNDQYVLISKPFQNTIVHVETGEIMSLQDHIDIDSLNLTGLEEVWHVKDSDKTILVTLGVSGYNAIVYDRVTHEANLIMQDNLQFGLQEHDGTFSLWTSGLGEISIYTYNMQENNLDVETFNLENKLHINLVEFNEQFIIYEGVPVNNGEAVNSKRYVEVIERQEDSEGNCTVHKLNIDNFEIAYFEDDAIIIDTGQGITYFSNGVTMSSIPINEMRKRQERKLKGNVLEDTAIIEDLKSANLIQTEPKVMELAPGMNYFMFSVSNGGAMGFLQMKNRTFSRDLLFAGIFSQYSGFLYVKYQDHSNLWAAEVTGRGYENEHRIRGVLIKPFIGNRFSRLELFGGYEFETKAPNYNPNHNLIVGSRVGVDSSLSNETGPQQGTSLFLNAEAGLNPASGIDHANLNFDIRQRFSPHPLFSLFIGAHGGTSQGDDPYTYLNGGSVSLRGYEWGSLPGNNYLIGSAEARFHLWDLLVAVWKEPLRDLTYYTMAMGGLGVYYDAGLVGDNGNKPEFYHSFGITGDFLTPIGQLGFWVNVAGGEKSFGLNLWGKK